MQQARKSRLNSECVTGPDCHSAITPRLDRDDAVSQRDGQMTSEELGRARSVILEAVKLPVSYRRDEARKIIEAELGRPVTQREADTVLAGMGDANLLSSDTTHIWLYGGRRILAPWPAIEANAGMENTANCPVGDVDDQFN